MPILDTSIIGSIRRLVTRMLTKINLKTCKEECAKENLWSTQVWKNLQVGNIVKLECNESVPADIVVLSTSDTEGICYLETKSMDGESNLKLRKGPDETLWIKELRHCEQFCPKLILEEPNPAFGSFQGTLRSDGKDTCLSTSNLLLRGCNLRNTEWVIGLVAYTGMDTKIYQNAGSTPSKRTRIEKFLNPQIIIVVLLLLSISLVTGITYLLYFLAFAREKVLFDVQEDINSMSIFFACVSTWAVSIIYYQNLIPISLFVTLEMVKSAHAYFIHCDDEMRDPNTGISCVVKSWNLSDDMGQIGYIFSDKTGTLTENIMELKKCSIGGQFYGEKYTELSKEEKIALFQKISIPKTYHVQDKTLPSFFDEEVYESIKNNPENDVGTFFLALALCHSVVSETKENKICYMSQSPDEETLVNAAHFLGITFIKRTKSKIFLEVNQLGEEYEVLNILEFSSDRKRMSIIIRDKNQIIILICKGADNVIFERLENQEDPINKETLDHLHIAAKQGLRTLCVAQKIIDANDYTEWNTQYQSTEDEAKKADLQDSIEQKLILLGATAIEDKLQENVPDTIEKISLAGIKLWVLTGDKLETAISIGFSCRMLNNAMSLMIIEGADGDATTEQLKQSLSEIEKHEGCALAIDGKSLSYALNDKNRNLFLEVACKCVTVICCRVSPLQKAQVVQLVKVEVRSLCLSIGDGANDVGMINEADIGVGITGLEGNQAAMSADYAIAKFYYLQRLLFVHGRWNYRRIALLIFLIFYKNAIWTFTIFWFQFDCAFSASVLYEFSYINYFNLFFTALPSFAFGIFDQNIDEKTAIMYPQLYNGDKFNEFYNNEMFWGYTADAILQSFIIYYYTVFFYASGINSEGFSSSAIEMGTYMAFVVIMVSTFHASSMFRNWTILNFLFFITSMFLFPIFIIVCGEISDSLKGLRNQLLGSASFWISLAPIFVGALLPRTLFLYIKTNYFPKDLDIIREQTNTRREKRIWKKMNPKLLFMRTKKRQEHTGFAFS